MSERRNKRIDIGKDCRSTRKSDKESNKREDGKAEKKLW